MGSQLLFHPDHRIPAAKLVAAVVEHANHVIAKMFMKTGAVLGQVFVLSFRIADAGLAFKIPWAFKAVSRAS